MYIGRLFIEIFKRQNLRIRRRKKVQSFSKYVFLLLLFKGKKCTGSLLKRKKKTVFFKVEVFFYSNSNSKNSEIRIQISK